MSKRHDRPVSGRRLAEPVQVYLVRGDRDRLERLAAQLDATKSDVLRRALRALVQQIADPTTHPALRMIGLADREVAPPAKYDVAREHDRFLAEAETAAWRPPRRKPRGR
jgi:Arc/MetJ-type ribon-helix-helix transcriptional regulator